MTNDWKIFQGSGQPHDTLTRLPPAPPWRLPGRWRRLQRPSSLDLDAERARAEPFITNEEMILAVNTALYLRRPLLITGKPGAGKSTLISKVAHELKLGPVLRWPINSRTSVRSGLYEYDAIGRLQSFQFTQKIPEPRLFLSLGPLGTALTTQTWPMPLLIDEIDKSDLDFANDLLNVIEEGEFEIPELQRIEAGDQVVRDCMGRDVIVSSGRIRCGQFPFIIMTSNAEREFPAPFLRRCVRLTIQAPGPEQLANILRSQLAGYGIDDDPEVRTLLDRFIALGDDWATDQLLNTVFLTVGMRTKEARTFDVKELERLRKELLIKRLSGA